MCRVPALFGVGLEGFWGLLISCAALPILALVTGPNGMPLDSLPAALREIRASRQLQVCWSPLQALRHILQRACRES